MFEEPRRGHGGCVVAETGERAGSGHPRAAMAWSRVCFLWEQSKGCRGLLPGEYPLSGCHVEWGAFEAPGVNRVEEKRSFWKLKRFGKCPRFYFPICCYCLPGDLSFVIFTQSGFGCAILTVSNFWFGISAKVISFLEPSSHWVGNFWLRPK